VERKTELGPLDGTPKKRMFWSIISDYDLRTGLCELIDNSIDQWSARGHSTGLKIEILVDSDRQVISIDDNAGGVARQDLEALVSPGGSKNDPYGRSIGIFGVGSKRAVIALAAQVSIKTSTSWGQSYQIDIDDDWLESASWEIPFYAIPDVMPGTTRVELTGLRRPLTASDQDELLRHFDEVYSTFLKGNQVMISVNGVDCAPKVFNHWAYPPDYAPCIALFDLPIEPSGPVTVQIAAGLITDRDPSRENYGVYIYCNDRLVVKELRVREVGYFVTGEAGVPHPDASLCRVIVDFAGAARHMPWNSSKSGINFEHPVFQATRVLITDFVTRYTRLSRALKRTWEEDILAYKEGEPEVIINPAPGEMKKVHLPPVPRVRVSHIEGLLAHNETSTTKMPWTLGLVESIGLVDVIMRQRAQTRSRAALILLDSCLEIGFKEFIVHDQVLSQNVNLAQLFGNRDNVIARVVSKRPIRQELLDVAKHYYQIRNKLVHEKATVAVTDNDIETYRSVVTQILSRLFQLKFS